MFQFSPVRIQQKPFSRSNTILKNCARAVMALGLASFLFLAPLSFLVSGQEPESPKASSSGRDHFIVYLNFAGEIVCREATLEERRVMDKVNPQGLRQINHLEPLSSQKTFSAQSGETVLPDHLTIILRATAQLEANEPAKAAFIRAAQTWENEVKSPVTIYLDVDFGPTNFGQAWGSGTIGATSSPTMTSLYQSVRTNLIAGASTLAEGSLYNSLATSALPTNKGDHTSINVSRSIARALGLLDPTAQPGDAAPRIGFNSAFTYDFDPNDGSDGPGGDGIDTGKTDFEAVATHEIGHALGFTSRAGRTDPTPPAIWDMFRFRSGTTLATFGTAQRIMTADGLQFYFSGPSEVGLSTGGADGQAPGGDGQQSSHWKDDFPSGIYVGIMDPTISTGVRRQITSNDTIALNSFGYNLDNNNPPPPPPPPPPVPANNNFANAQILAVSGCAGSATGTNIGADKETGELNHSPDENPGGGSVWYHWQAPSSGSVTINTSGSNYDTMLAVYTGNSVGGLTLIVRNDDVSLGTVVHSEVTFSAVAGTVYKIAVDGWGGDAGNILLNWLQGGCTTAMTAQFSAAAYQVAENAGSLQIVVNRADVSSSATVTYATKDTAGLTSCTIASGAASERCDYQTTVGTLRFAVGETTKSFIIPIIDDSHSEGAETFTVFLKTSTGTLLSAPVTATVTIVDDGNPVQNPFDNNQFFITMQYIDFLARLPDSGGLAGWTDVLNGCPNNGFGNENPDCDRVHVSSGFFLSEEFRGRGYWAYRFYEVAFNRRPTYAEFVPDMAQVGGPQSPESELLSKNAYKDDFVQRSEFTILYNGLSNAAFVNAIEANAEVDLENAELTAQLDGGKSRSQLLREIVESKAVEDKFFIRAFVAMQYFGYLRRDPDTDGYNGWVATLTSNPSDFRHMLFGFIYSEEYRSRFGP